MVTTPSRLRLYCWAVLLLTSINAVSALLNPVELVSDRPMLTGTLADPNDLALHFCIGIPLALALMQSSRQPVGKLVAALLTALLVWAVLSTKSRGGTIGLAVVLFLEGYLRIPHRVPRRAFAIVGVLLCLGLVMHTMSARSGESDEQSKIERKGAWRAGFNMMRRYPLTGVGVGLFGDRFEEFKPTWPELYEKHTMTAHSSVFLVMGEMGVPGLLIYLALLKELLLCTRRVRDASRRGLLRLLPGGEANRALYECLVRSYAGWFVPAMFLSQTWREWFFVVAGLIVAADLQVRRATAGEATLSEAARLAGSHVAS
jgi:O-antigen ligase